MPRQSKFHQFKTRAKGHPRKQRKGQTKQVRIGARMPGSSYQGSIRRPF